MELLLTFSSALLTIIPLTHYASASVPMISIPLYNTRMLNDTMVMASSSGILHPQKEATAEIYFADDIYAMFMLIGTPVQVQFVMMDTGSPFTWSQCDHCSHCYPMLRSPFYTHASSTFRELSCYSDTCMIPMMREILGNCTETWNCRYNVKYGNNKDQSHSLGMMVTETLHFEDSDSQVKNFIMGCGDSYEGPFRAQFSGVLGLGRGQLSLQSQLNAKAFSFCLVSPESEKPSTLEFYDSVPHETEEHGVVGNNTNSIMVPLRENSGYPFYYFVQFVGMGINGFMLEISSSVWGYGFNYDGGVLIDSGTILMYLPSDAYKVFRSEIRRTDANLKREPGPEGLEFCYKDDAANVYPTIEFYFENGSIEGENFVSWKLSNKQMLFKAKEGTVCLSFAEGKGSALTVIGSNLLQGTQLTYDLVHQILVFTFNKC